MFAIVIPQTRRKVYLCFIYANVLESRTNINYIFQKYSSNTFYGIHLKNAIKRYSVFTKI